MFSIKLDILIAIALGAILVFGIIIPFLTGTVHDGVNGLETITENFLNSPLKGLK